MNKKKKFTVFSIILLFDSILCTSCLPKAKQSVKDAPSSLTETVDVTNNTPVTGETYTYDNGMFRQLYEKALSDVKGGIRPDVDPPVSPDETGFAIIPLGEKFYNVDNFAILPVLTRKLTDGEMLQLAHKMGGISFEKLISPSYSFMGGDAQEVYYRPLQWEERIRKYQLECQYQFEGLRPSKLLTNSSKSGDPIYVDIKNGYDFDGTFWIFPKQTMTDEQLLDIIEKQFNVPQEYFQPLEAQDQYTDLEETLEKMISDYHISDKKLDAYYPYYMTDRYVGILKRPDFWYIRLNFSEGYDYNITFNAEDGTLTKWVRFPKGYYDEKEPDDYTTNLTNSSGIEHSDEEIRKTAEVYITKAILKDGITIKDSIILQTFDRFFYGGGLIGAGNGKFVSVTLSNNKKYKIAVMTDDLSIQSLESENSQTE